MNTNNKDNRKRANQIVREINEDVQEQNKNYEKEKWRKKNDFATVFDFMICQRNTTCN